MHVNDASARSRGEQQARQQNWTFSEHQGYARADCRHCAGTIGLTRLIVRHGHADRDLYRLDQHTRDVHKLCSGELHTMPHVGCILR